jgi:HAD superfamily hydrolase (TIGR01509 family)
MPTAASTAAPGLDILSMRWRVAFRAARDALGAAESLPTAERNARTQHLSAEVLETQKLLEALALEHHSRRLLLPLAVSPLEARRLLGLPTDVGACVFNLDGVLVGSAELHSAAWLEVFDEFLLDRVDRTRGEFVPYNPRLDYPAHLHARPRLDGVRAFLASRGIRLPEGEQSDPPGAETVNGLANQKNDVLRRLLADHGAHAFEGSQSYLELAHEAGVRCAVVSASANTDTILEQTGLAELVDGSVDGNTIRRDRLRVKPEPDTLLAACHELGVDPGHAATFETTRAGVAAARTAGFRVIVGVAGAVGGDRREALRAEGAEIVVGGISEMLERRLAA